MATEKQPKKKKASSKSAEKPAKADQPAPAPEKAEGQPEMRSALLPLLWLLIPFAAVVVYGLLTKE